MKGYALLRYGESITPFRGSPTISSPRTEPKLDCCATRGGDKDGPFPPSGEENGKVGYTDMKGNLSGGQDGTHRVPLHPLHDSLGTPAECFS